MNVQGNVSLSDRGVDQHASLLLRHADGCDSQIAVSLRVLLQNRVTVSSGRTLIAIEPPAIGAEVVRTVTARGHESLASDPLNGQRWRARIGDALRRRPVLRRIASLRQAGTSKHLDFGADPYLPMLSHFCDLKRACRSSSDVMPPALSTAVLTVIDHARHLSSGGPLEPLR